MRCCTWVFVNTYNCLLLFSRKLILLTKNYESPGNMLDLSIHEAIELLEPVLRGGITRTRVYVRSADDITLQNAFDVWHASTEWKPPAADTASKRFAGVNWRGSKHTEYWAYFEQCAHVVDGNPQVSCLLCANLLQHPVAMEISQ
jgi:hypothetical protein